MRSRVSSLGRLRRPAALLGTLASPLLLAVCSDTSGPEDYQDAPYEVWLVDQSDSPGKNFGGTLYIYDGADVSGASAASAQPRETIDLANQTAALCLQSTGANPVRPHMLAFNREQSHAILAFVASGHVVIYNAATRQPLSCIRTSRSATGQQAHAAFPTPDGAYILVANQNGKRLERIDANFTAGTFTQNPSATLDLATCSTPNGLPCESPELRPDNAPICPVIDSDSRYAWVTLRGGGLLVVDVRQTPMRIVAEYDKNTVKGNGCGGIEANDRMYLNSGGRPGNLAHLTLHGFEVYRFPLSGYATTGSPNTPAPTVIFSGTGERDSHGMMVTGRDRFLWVFDRHANRAEIFSTASGTHVTTVPLTGALTTDPAPDLVDRSPSGDRLFVALRGRFPLSGDPHIATGSSPGLGIVEVTNGGQGGSLAAVLRISNPDAAGTDRADAHAVRVRRK